MLAHDIAESGTLPAALNDAARDVANTVARMVQLHAEHPADQRPDVIHAYRFEEMRDGSVVAIYATELGGVAPVTIELRAFDSLQDASRWTPRNEYAGWTHGAPAKAPGEVAGDVEFVVGQVE